MKNRRPARNAFTSYEVLEGRRLMSAALEAAHVAPPRPAGTVYTFAPQPAAGLTASAVSSHTKGVPVLSSRPGAAYNVFIDFAGFNYVGSWNGSTAANGDMLPGFTPSFDDVSPTGTFNAGQQKAIRTVWARMAQSYSNLDVNITTVDPAPAAIQSDDVARRNFYDAMPNFMHMVFGSSERAAYVTADNPSGNWLPGADGVSPGIGVASGRVDGPNAKQGQHTSFMFTQGHADDNGPISNFDAEYVGGIGSHENAHSFGLNHQGDYTGNGVNHINEYSFGDDRTAPFQNGTYVPIIGDGNSAQRITWRIGTDDEQDENGVYTVVNDLQRLLYMSSAAYAASEGRTGAVDLHFIDDGVGNTLATATPLPLTGSTVNFAEADGVIVPKSEGNPVAMGAANYTTDYFSFVSNGSTQITLNVNDSTQLLVSGKADGAGTLNSSLTIYRANGTVAGVSSEDVTTLVDTFTGVLPAGTYYAAVGSRGGHQQVNAPVEGVSFDPAYYFDTGAFFLTGSGFSTGTTPPPTPASISGTIFNDHNGSGTKDPGDAAISGVKVYLDKNKSGTFNAGETFVYSNGAGVYKFTNVTPGTYSVRTVPPTGFQQNFPFAQLAQVVTVGSGSTVTGKDFGETTSSHVSGFVRLSTNGVLTDMAGVKVTVKATDGTGPTYTLTTNAKGNYGIGGLPNKMFTVTLQLPPGYKLASGSTVRMTPKLGSGQNADDISFKLLKTFA